MSKFIAGVIIREYEEKKIERKIAINRLIYIIKNDKDESNIKQANKYLKKIAPDRLNLLQTEFDIIYSKLEELEYTLANAIGEIYIRLKDSQNQELLINREYFQDFFHESLIYINSSDYLPTFIVPFELGCEKEGILIEYIGNNVKFYLD